MLQEKALLHMNSTNKVSFSFILQYLFNSCHRTLFHGIEFIKFCPRILEKNFFLNWKNEIIEKVNEIFTGGCCCCKRSCKVLMPLN